MNKTLLLILCDFLLLNLLALTRWEKAEPARAKQPPVPELAASAVGRLWQQRGARPVSQVVAHPGGRDVLAALAPVVAPYSLDASARVLRDFGNMSSPSVLFALEEALNGRRPVLLALADRQDALITATVDEANHSPRRAEANVVSGGAA